MDTGLREGCKVLLSVCLYNSPSAHLKNHIPKLHKLHTCRRRRPSTAWMDNIKTWKRLPVEDSIRTTADRDKQCGQHWHRGRLKNITEQAYHIISDHTPATEIQIIPQLFATGIYIKHSHSTRTIS